ncbi:MAG: 2-dehydropantoate 2-reductase [Deltaproteobacteria bacterium]
MLSGSFSLAGFKVSLLDYRPDRAEHLHRQGIILVRQGREEKVRVPVFCQPGAGLQADLLFLCVKASAVAATINQIQPLLNANNLLITLQNGIGHLDFLNESLGQRGAWAAGVTALGAHLRAVGEVVFAGSGLSRFGFPGSAGDMAKQLLNRVVIVFKQSGFDAEVTDAIEQRIWEKLMINVGINALTAIHELTNGQLLEDPALTTTMRAAITEAEDVAKARGIALAGDSFAGTAAVCRATSTNISSMLQDVRHHKRTEIDAINGAIVRLAEELGIEAPANRSLTEQVKKLEQRYL